MAGAAGANQEPDLEAGDFVFGNSGNSRAVRLAAYDARDGLGACLETAPSGIRGSSAAAVFSSDM